MAFRLGDEEDLGESHDINVTPMIDVMLVLLIIFMVAAPLATVDVPVSLPNSTANPAQRPAKPVFLTLRSDLTLSLGQNSIDRAGLAQALDAATGGDRSQTVFLRADKSVPYGDLMDVMNTLRTAAYTKVSLVAVETVGQ